VLFGTPLAEEGIKDRIDMFMRQPQARMEVPVIVYEGRAGNLLAMQPEQDQIAGIYLERMMQGLAAMSPFYQVRLIDFASRLLDPSSAPVAPLVKVVREGVKREIKLDGMAVFKGDRMIGRLDNSQTAGYVWSMGNVQKSVVQAGSHLGKAVFHIVKLNCKRKVTLRPDSGVKVALTVDADLTVDELSGFDNMTAEKLTPCLIAMAQNEIRHEIMNSYAAASRLDADIFGFGTSVYRKYPKQWRTMKGQWDEQFRNIDLSVQARVRLEGVGKIGNSLEMKGE
jgi:spore germination protein KC